MLLTLIIGALAGWAARPAEPKITEILVGVVGQDNMPKSDDRRVMSMVVCLTLAALLLWIGTDAANPLLFVLAAGAGYFQAEIREAILNRRG